MEKHFKDKKDWAEHLAKQKATEYQWGLVDMAIKAFIAKYPLHWIEFQKQLNAQRTTYNLAKDGELKKAGFRNTASFPTIEDQEGNTIDSLKPVIEKFIPQLCHKKSVNYREFLKRYKMFLPAERL